MGSSRFSEKPSLQSKMDLHQIRQAKILGGAGKGFMQPRLSLKTFGLLVRDSRFIPGCRPCETYLAPVHAHPVWAALNGFSEFRDRDTWSTQPWLRWESKEAGQNWKGRNGDAVDQKP